LGRLIGIAFILGIPVAWWMMDRWLENFAYHIGLGWTVFLFSCLIAWLIALITVSMEATKAAMTNPVDVLQKEG